MESYEIISAEQLKGKIRHTVKNRDKHQEIDYFDVRMGLCWDPPFAIICAEEWFDRLHRPARGQGLLRVLDELKGSVLDLWEFFDRVSDATTLLLVSDIYTDLTDTAFTEVFQDWSDRRSLHASLVSAPYVDRVEAGLSLVKGWDRAGLLELGSATTAYGELKALTEDGLDDPGGPLTALRYVIGSFQKFPPLRGSLDYSRPDPSGGSPLAWMGA